MVYELRPILIVLTIFYLVNIVVGMRMPVRERQLPSANGIHPLEHRIGDVLHKISSSVKGIPRNSDFTTPAVVPVPIPANLRSDIQAAVFVLRETQLQILSVLSVQIKIQEKLAYWQLAPHQTKIDGSQTNDNVVVVPSELPTDGHKINSVEHQMAHLLQRISSSSSSHGWAKTARVNRASNDNKDPSLLYSAIKEAASVFQETQVQISSILAVQSDIQQSLDYWQVELVRLISPENASDGIEDNTINPPAVLPCYPTDTESKTSWLLKAFVCHSPLHATFWINSGANGYWRSSNNGHQTAVQLAVSRNWRSVVELLFKRGADCRIRFSQPHEETLLQLAVRDGVEAPLVRLLISAGCEVNATEGLNKQTALHLACEMGRKDVADLLVRQGRANIEAQDQMGFRPLHSAVRSPQIVTMLIASGADIGATTVTGMTPLHLAVTEHQMATVRILVKAGAKVGNAFDVHGYTPLDYAAELKDYEMRNLLAPYASIDEYFVDMPAE